MHSRGLNETMEAEAQATIDGTRCYPERQHPPARQPPVCWAGFQPLLLYEQCKIAVEKKHNGRIVKSYRLMTLQYSGVDRRCNPLTKPLPLDVSTSFRRAFSPPIISPRHLYFQHLTVSLSCSSTSSLPAWPSGRPHKRAPCTEHPVSSGVILQRNSRPSSPWLDGDTPTKDECTTTW